MHDVLRIDAAGLPIFGRPAGPNAPRGYYLLPDGFKGWRGGLAVRREDVARPNAHGSHDARGTRGARVLVLDGLCVTSSAADTEVHGDRLMGLLANGDQGLIQVQSVTGLQYALGRLAEASFEPRGRTPWLADWQLQFWFPNPRKYGESRPFTSGADGRWFAHHRGNFDASPVIRVTGNDPTGYTIGGPGSTVYKVRAPLVPGIAHDIDLGSGQISVGGAVRFGITSKADTWVIPPGIDVAQRIVPDSGTVTVVQTVKDTYV